MGTDKCLSIALLTFLENSLDLVHEIEERPEMTAKIDPGFQAALVAVRDITGKNWGAQSWLARQTGVSRQSLKNWQRLGIPEHMLPEVAKVTGLPIKKIASTRLRAAAAAYRKMF